MGVTMIPNIHSLTLDIPSGIRGGREFWILYLNKNQPVDLFHDNSPLTKPAIFFNKRFSACFDTRKAIPFL